MRAPKHGAEVARAHLNIINITVWLRPRFRSDSRLTSPVPDARKGRNRLENPISPCLAYPRPPPRLPAVSSTRVPDRSRKRLARMQKCGNPKLPGPGKTVGPKPLKLYIGKVLPVNAHLVGYRLPLNSNADDACERGTEGYYQRARYTRGRLDEMLD